MKAHKRLVFFLILFLLSLFVIFFYKGLNGYKKGLDIAGGVRLTYKIDLAKYRQLYSGNSAEFAKVRNRVEDIISKNIDNRISKLGVSDYTSRIETLNDEDYLVIEIGGLTDVEQAKQIIGKTVELEFKIPAENTENTELLAQRQNKAQTLLKEVINTPNLFAEIGSGKISEDVYYSHYTGNSLAELPLIYSENIGEIEKIAQGSVYSGVFEGNYVNQFVQEGEGLVQKTLKGWTIVKFNGKKINSLDEITSTKLYSTLKTKSIDYKDIYEKQAVQIKPQTIVYDETKKQAIYNAGELFSGEQAYDADIYTYTKPDLLGKQVEEISQINSGVELDLQNIKTALENNIDVVVSGANQVYSGWTSQESLTSQIKTFSLNEGETIKIFEEEKEYYILKIKDTKKYSEILDKTTVVNNISKDEFTTLEKDLKTEILYDIEDIFIKDYPSWVVATDPKTGSILNGEYFRYANVDQGNTADIVVSISFDDKGKEIFCNLTESYVGKQMAIFVGGEIKTAPRINEKICGGSAQISGKFTMEEAKKLADDLNEGALPAKLILAHEDKVSPTLGENALKGAMWAGALGFVLILVMMIIMYGPKKGFIAISSLIVFLTILFAIVKLIGYSLSLSGLAAILLNIGMGVDANVLIFERMKEELKSGKALKASILDGVSRSWLAIRDGNLTIAFIGLLLVAIGTNMFKGFGFMMLINIFLTFFVIVPLTKDLLLYFYEKQDDKNS